MTPPSPVPEGSFARRSLRLHIGRRRMVVLGVAGAFLGIAVVFGALAFFQSSPTPNGSSNISVPVTDTYTVAPPVPSSPAAGETGSPVPVTSVVTVTSTRIVSVPQASSGSSLGSVESGASTLAAVVAAICAVIALRPRRGVPPAAAAAAAGAADTTAGSV